MSNLQHIKTDNAPTPVGSYSQAVVGGNFVFCAGQIGLDPKSNELVNGAAAAQATQVMANLKAVLKAAGCEFTDVVRGDVFLANMNDYAVVTEVYGKHFSLDTPPARQTVVVSALPKDALVEISVIAHKAAK